MSETFPTEIRIGGQLKRKDFKRFVGSIIKGGYYLAWDTLIDKIDNQKDLLNMLDRYNHLVLTDPSASWGCMTFVEDMCCELGLYYEKFVAPHDEYPGELIYYPNRKLFLCDGDGKPYILFEEMLDLLNKGTDALYQAIQLPIIPEFQIV